jgi:uncharacterized cupredoxin-like copper-binding protein
MNHPRIASISFASVLLLSACAGAGPSTTGPVDDDHSSFTFGEPAAATDSDRTIEIIATDDFRFDPAELAVEAGETITFRVVNQGSLPHEFTLGDEATQAEHEEEMAEMGGMAMPADEPNSIGLAAGETKEITWRFTNPGTILIGCHTPGHYAAGMRGEVTVEG